jgi:hypothetical protein
VRSTQATELNNICINFHDLRICIQNFLKTNKQPNKQNKENKQNKQNKENKQNQKQTKQTHA